MLSSKSGWPSHMDLQSGWLLHLKVKMWLITTCVAAKVTDDYMFSYKGGWWPHVETQRWLVTTYGASKVADHHKYGWFLKMKVFSDHT